MTTLQSRLKKSRTERSDTVYNKYSNTKCRCAQGHIHDSKKEAKRCNELTILERAGIISGLQQQVKFILIPAQREISREIYTKGAKKGQPKEGKVLEKECSYYADFVYTENGQYIVEDTKGMRTPDYKIKKKLMLYVHGIRIREI